MPTTAEPTKTSKRGTAMERITQSLRSRAKTPGQSDTPTQEPPSAPAPVTPPPKLPTEEESTAPEGAVSSPESAPSTSDAASGEAVPAKPAEKTSPWKLVDTYKKQTAALQKEIADLKNQITPETDRKALSERVEKAEALAKSLSDEIRYHNYEKSPEFAQQFQAPYEAAFRRALEDLAEVSVTDPESNVVRKFTGEDLAQLSFMSLPQAKDVANRLFPDFANDILAARKEIRAAWDKRQAALKEWKEKGSQREQERAEQLQKLQAELGNQIRTTWERANAEVSTDERHGKFFTEIEGDEEWNKRLTKGFELVDRTYAENPVNPELTPEQRALVIKRHAAVRARAAGWGALRYRNEQLEKKIADLEKELAEYKSSTPPAGGTESGAPTETAPAKAMDRLMQGLQKYAH